MYTRPYSESQAEIRIPENYVGNAFDEPEAIHTEEVTEEKITEDESTVTSSFIKTDEKKKAGILNLFGRGAFPFEPSKIFTGMFKDFGSEEILLIGVALCLLLSKERDIETCIILILLLFVK